MHTVLTNLAETLAYKRKYNVKLWRHKHCLSSNNDQHTPLLNTTIWYGAYNQRVAPGITRPQ